MRIGRVCGGLFISVVVLSGCGSSAADSSAEADGSGWQCPVTPGDLEAAYPGSTAAYTGTGGSKVAPDEWPLLESPDVFYCDLTVTDGRWDGGLITDASYSYSFSLSEDNDTSAQDARDANAQGLFTAGDSPCDGSYAVRSTGEIADLAVVVFLEKGDGYVSISAANDPVTGFDQGTTVALESGLARICEQAVIGE